MTTSQSVMLAVGLKNIVEKKRKRMDVIICIINLRNTFGAVLTCYCKHIQTEEKSFKKRKKFQPNYFVTFNKSLYRIYFQSPEGEADSFYHHFYG